MDSSALSLSSSISISFSNSLHNLTSTSRIPCRLSFRGVNSCRIFAVSDSPNGFVPHSASEGAKPNSSGDVHSRLSSLESLFCYDKAIPEERIEKPVGVSIAEKVIGDNARCSDCQAKGAVLCTTCSGSGLYVDSILESQGIIVKVRCLGCGGSGNIMCLECGGRGHLGHTIRKI